MDQLYPMMYFKENNFYPFAIDWQEQSSGRTIVSGLGIYMLHPQERNWPLSEVRRQLEVTRQIGLGHCYFRAKFLLSNVKGIYDYVKTFDRHPALTPPMTWANNGTVIPPSAPTGLHIERSKEGDDLSWLPAENHNDSPYLLYNVYASTTEPVDVTSAANLVAVRCTKTELSIKRSDKSPLLHYAVTAVDRYGNESLPIQSTKQKVPTAVVKPLLFIQHDGSRLQVPDRNLFDARKLIVCDMHGREVMSCPDSPSIDISQLPNGVYVLRSQHRKGYQHRLGYFIIKREKNHGENHIRH